MRRKTSALRLGSLTVLTALLLVAGFDVPARGGDPRGAFYSPDTDKVFWFIHFADIHIGAAGDQDTFNLNWLVTTGKSVIAPAFMVAAGDLTDSTNGNWLGYPNGPYQAEWDVYKNILNGRVTASDYYDLPGNHDAYSDKYFAYYLANSVQGRATNRTQHSWTHSLGTRTYHFLGVNSSANNGAAFSLSFPYGDYAGLDETELGYINQALYDNRAADLTLVFGHHPVTDTGVSTDTWLFYGHREFIGALDGYAGSLYGYGHTHRYSDVLFNGNSYTGTMTGDGVRYLNISSLGKASSSHYSVIAVDCNGVSAVAANVGQWPVVLVTAPVAKGPNPYAYTVPAAAGNPIRALVFDAGNVSSVHYRIDGAGDWYAMGRVADNPRLWTGTWDASGLAAGDHTVTVQAVGTSTRSHTITVTVAVGVTPNEPPVAHEQTVDVQKNVAKAITLTATDPDGDSLTYSVVSGPSHGSLSGTAPSLTYTPGAGYVGSDSFTFKANDGQADSDAATVVLNVFNTAPVATNDSYATDQDTALSVPAPGVLGNDADPDGDPLTAVLGTGPANGTLNLSADGAFIYTPNSGFSETDSFTYAVSDGTDASAPATVTITVRASGPDTVTILTATYNTKAKKLYVEATSSAQPAAVLTVVGYGEMSWVESGQKYVFDKRVSSPPGDSVTVTSDEGGADVFYFGGTSNSAPVAHDQSVTVLKDTPTAIILTAADPDGDSLTYSVVSGPSHGSLSGAAPNLTYTPSTGYVGADSFTFKANDGAADSNVAAVSIIVTSGSADVIQIPLAEYVAKTRILTVHATSTLAPSAVLTLEGYGAMTYDAGLGLYVYSKRVKTAPMDVTVTSSLGGSATMIVTMK